MNPLMRDHPRSSRPQLIEPQPIESQRIEAQRMEPKPMELKSTKPKSTALGSIAPPQADGSVVRPRRIGAGSTIATLIILGLLTGLATSFFGAQTASAHDQLTSTTPTESQNLDSPPTEVVLEFSDDVLAIGAVVLVVDSAGTNWAEGSIVLAGRTATQPLATGSADGIYQVRWRVVSSDGHPISGTFSYSVGSEVGSEVGSAIGSSAPSAAATTGASGLDAAKEAEAADSTTNSTTNSTNNGSGTAGPAADTPGELRLPLPLVGVLGALAGITVLALVLWLRRRRLGAANR